MSKLISENMSRVPKEGLLEKQFANEEKKRKDACLRFLSFIIVQKEKASDGLFGFRKDWS